MLDNLTVDLLARLAKVNHELKTFSQDDPPARWGQKLEAQAELYWQLYSLQNQRKYLEQAIRAYESAATYYGNVGENYFTAMQYRLQRAYVAMAQYERPATYLYMARDAGIKAQAFYIATNADTRATHFEILGLQTQILTSLAVLEQYPPYGDEAIRIGKIIIEQTRNEGEQLAFHIEGHRVLGKIYLGLSRMMDYAEGRALLLEATRVLGKLRRFTHQAEGADAMLRGLLLMAFAYIELEFIENNADYLPPAIRTFQQAIKVNESVDDPLAAAVASYTISMLYERMEKPRQVIESAQQAADFYRQSDMNWMAQIASFRAWYFGQSVIVRGLLYPVYAPMNLFAYLHRRNAIPRVLT